MVKQIYNKLMTLKHNVYIPIECLSITNTSTNYWCCILFENEQNFISIFLTEIDKSSKDSNDNSFRSTNMAWNKKQRNQKDYKRMENA